MASLSQKIRGQGESKGKMKKVGIVYFKNSGNIGDDVQTLAMYDLVRRIQPDVDIKWVDRESLDGPEVNELDGLIVNGWFMDHPENWPPNNSNVLVVSMHINSQNGASRLMQREELNSFYKLHEPIGCRDGGTAKRFQSLGVEAYFSGCATLTLQASGSSNRNVPGEVLAIDPFYKVVNTTAYQKWRLSQILSKEEWARCSLISNDWPLLNESSQAQRLLDARAYLERIAAAECVITSRIHAALPALAVGTPVYFVDAGYDRSPAHRDRFEGIVDLFNVIKGDHFRFIGRKRSGKLLRWIKVDRLLDRQNRAHVWEEAKQNRKEGAQPEVLDIQKNIEGAVRTFLTSL